MDGTQSFNATITGLDDQRIEWSVDNVVGGNEKLGTIENNNNPALYAAPAGFPDKNTVVIKATSIANTTIVATATVTLFIPTFQLSPQNPVVPKATPQQFSVEGIDASQVDWLINGVQGGSADIGTIDANGLYKPPSIIPTDTVSPLFGNPVPVTVEAVSKVDSNIRDTTTVNLVTGPSITFEPNVPINLQSSFRPTLSSGQRSIAFYNGEVYIVWNQNGRILFAKSSDGISWPSPPIEVSPIEDARNEPTLAIGRNGDVYVAYAECVPCSGLSTIGISVLFLGATDFQQLPIPATGTGSLNPTIAVSDDETIYLAWAAVEDPDTSFDILFQRFSKDGKPIDATPQNVTPVGRSQAQPAITISKSGEIYLAWVDNGVIMATVFNGTSFLAPTPVTDLAQTIASNPSIVGGPQGTVYVAWQDTRLQFPFVFFDVGTITQSVLTFGTDKALGSFSKVVNPQTSPSIALDPHGGIYVAFQEGFDGFRSRGIFLAKSTDGGSTFNVPTRIDDDVNQVPNKSFPSIAVDNAGRTFAIWSDGRGGTSIPSDYVWFAKGE